VGAWYRRPLAGGALAVGAGVLRRRMLAASPRARGRTRPPARDVRSPAAPGVRSTAGPG
jgi:hypothetical protein